MIRPLPHSPFSHELNKEITLVEPFVIAGDIGNPFHIFSNSPYLHSGLVLTAFPGHQVFRVLSTSTE